MVREALHVEFQRGAADAGLINAQVKSTLWAGEKDSIDWGSTEFGYVDM